MTRKYNRRFQFWQGYGYFDYLVELPPYAKILMESSIRTADIIPSTEYHINITEGKSRNIPQFKERPPNTTDNADRQERTSSC